MSDINDYMLDEDKHRFVFKALLIENAEMSHPGEFVIDPSNGIVYLKGEDGLLHSKAADIASEFQSLKDAGVIQAALAYENNAEIYTLYIRDNKCRISEMLKLSRNVRYYAVRGMTADNTSYQYVTGNLVPGGGIENVLVDVIHDISDPLLAYTGSAQPGTLHTPSEILDGHPYFIDFFDVNRIIIATVPCQIQRVQALNFALAPERNIVSLSISTNQDTVDPLVQEDPFTFLYQGQSLTTLNVYVVANYADGSSRNINHELASSRLVIEYPTGANSDIVGTEFDITARYYTEELNTGTGGTYNDVNYASITTTRKVRIVPDVYVGIKYLLPVPYVRNSELNVREIFPIVFAHYANDAIEDVTVNSRLAIDSGFMQSQFGSQMQFDVSLGVGNGQNVFSEENIMLLMSSSTYGAWDVLTVPNSPLYKNQGRSFPCGIAVFDTITEPGVIRMRLNKGFNDAFASVNDFTDLGRVQQVDNSYKIPTHFRVRSVIDSTFYHTMIPLPVSQFSFFTIDDFPSPAKTLAAFTSSNNGVPYPVLVEFLTYDAAAEVYTKLSMAPFFTQSQFVVL